MILRGRGGVPGERKRNAHGGAGPYEVRTYLQGADFASSLAYVREIALPPGSSIGTHRHEGDEELYYIASGEGIMTVDGEEQRVVAGDLVLTRSGSEHGLRATGSADLVFFVACAKLVPR